MPKIPELPEGLKTGESCTVITFGGSMAENDVAEAKSSQREYIGPYLVTHVGITRWAKNDLLVPRRKSFFT